MCVPIKMGHKFFILLGAKCERATEFEMSKTEPGICLAAQVSHRGRHLRKPLVSFARFAPPPPGLGPDWLARRAHPTFSAIIFALAGARRHAETPGRRRDTRPQRPDPRPAGAHTPGRPVDSCHLHRQANFKEKPQPALPLRRRGQSSKLGP